MAALEKIAERRELQLELQKQLLAEEHELLKTMMVLTIMTATNVAVWTMIWFKVEPHHVGAWVVAVLGAVGGWAGRCVLGFREKYRAQLRRREAAAAAAEQQQQQQQQQVAPVAPVAAPAAAPVAAPALEGGDAVGGGPVAGPKGCGGEIGGGGGAARRRCQRSSEEEG